MKKLVFPLLALALSACTPTLQEASLWLSPSWVELRRGGSTTAFLNFVDRAGRDGTYNVSGILTDGKGVSVTLLGPSTLSGKTGTVFFKVSAARTAQLGKHTLELILVGKEGQLPATLTVNVVP